MLGEQLDAGVSGQAGASVDTLYDRMPDRPTADDAEDAELDEPVPNAERLVSEAVAVVGDDHAQAQLIDRFWRFAPDEELIGYTAQEMVEATRSHRELAEQRMPGELKLRITDPLPTTAHGHRKL